MQEYSRKLLGAVLKIRKYCKVGTACRDDKTLWKLSLQHPEWTLLYLCNHVPIYGPFFVMCASKVLNLPKPQDGWKMFGLSHSVKKLFLLASTAAWSINSGISLLLLSTEGQRFLSPAWTAAALSQSTSLQKVAATQSMNSLQAHTHTHTHNFIALHGS